ncbi:MAG TPA: hypothetical protein VE262_23895 [Blastocatellia bacterium]|nr:hypothetical protein [Blastocatellia bacterium]
MTNDNPTDRMPGNTSEIILGAIKNLSDKITALDRKVDARLHDTRPLWEGVQEQLSEIRARLGNVGDRLGNVEGRLGNLEDRFGALEDRFIILENRQAAMHADSEKWFRSLERRLEANTIEINKLTGEMRGVDERLSSLEPKPS